MKRVPSNENGLDKLALNIRLPLRDTIITQAYFSTALSAVADELTVETPLNIANSLQSTGNELLEAITEKHCTCMENFEHLLLWTSIGALSLGFKTMEEKKKESMFRRFTPFISYRDIRKQMNSVFIVLFFVFVRNIPSAI